MFNHNPYKPKMKRIYFFRVFQALLVFSLAFTLTNCGNIDNPLEELGGGSGSSVSVTSIELNKTTLDMKVGDADVTLTATVDPAGTAVTWSSDNAAATVTDGVVHAVAAGTAIITATAGDKSATCTVTVTEVYTAKDYKEGSWDVTNNKVVFTKQTAPSDPTVVADASTDVTWSGWYTVSGEVTITGTVTLKADTHLILQDGATLNCQTIDFSNSSGYTLYIYGQDKGDGKLNISYSSATALWGSSNGKIEIHGGEITAESTSGRGLIAKGIRVYGGKLTATSTGYDGIHFDAGNFEVYGGEVEGESTYSNGTAIFSSNTLKVYGGKVKATGGASGKGFNCKLLSGTDNIKFYFSDNGTDWSSGDSYDPAAPAPGDRYAKAE